MLISYDWNAQPNITAISNRKWNKRRKVKKSEKSLKILFWSFFSNAPIAGENESIYLFRHVPTTYILQHRKKQNKRDKQVDYPNTVLPKLICRSLECSSIKINLSFLQILQFRNYLQD
jgi:hypothetical protein